MSNEIEYDYWGVPITTYTEEECIEMMRDEVLTAKDYDDDTRVFEQRKGESTGYHNWLSKEDRELLIEYAAKLFDTLPKDKDLFDSMLGLVTIIGKHRFEVMWYKQENSRMGLYSHNKKNQEEKADALKKHIQAILGIIGIDSYVPKEGDLAGLRTSKDDFIDELERAHEDTMSYLPRGNPGYSLEENKHGEMVKVLHHTKQPMQEYLKSLHLKNRSIIIKEFIKKITDQNWFSTFFMKKQRPPIF